MKRSDIHIYHRLLAVILTVLSVVSFHEAWGQVMPSAGRGSFITSNLNTGQGLSSSRAYSAIESDDGAIWISTKTGVDRYNGITVKNYSLPRQHQYSDASGMVIRLLKTTDGGIIAYDNKGHIYCYDTVTDRFILRYDLTAVLGGTMVLNEVCADGNVLWAALDRGACRIDGGRAVLILKDHYVNHVAATSQGIIIGANDGLYLFRQGRTRKVAEVKAVLCSYDDATAHRLWLGTFHEGAVAVDDRTFSTIASDGLRLPLMPVRAIQPWDATTLFFGVDGAGVYSYDMTGHSTALVLSTDGSPTESLQGNGVYGLLRDHWDDLWVTTYSGGVDLAVPIGPMPVFVRHEYLNVQSLVNNSVNYILQDHDGNLWYATDHGVSIYNTRSRSWTHTLYNSVVLSLAEYNGVMLAATYGDGIFALGADGSSRLAYSTTQGNLKTNYVYSLLRDSHGGLWMGCLDGPLVELSPEGRREYPVKEVQCLVESPDHSSVAVGTTYGAYLIDIATGRATRFFYPEQFSNVDYNYFINAMVFDGNDRLWIATDGGGIYHYDLRSRQVSNRTVDSGLPSDVVSSLVWDSRRNLWMGTDRGLACLRGSGIININYVKGLECEYKRQAATAIAGDRLIFGSNQGAVVIAPLAAAAISYKAPLRITDIDVEGIDADSAWHSEMYQMRQRGELTLSHDHNSIVVHFESINYRYQNDIVYQCDLEGYDRQWSPLLRQQHVRYANLPPGSYTLHVRSASKSDNRTLGTATLHITIAEPWWNTLWAWLIYTALLAWLGYMGWSFYRNRLQRRYDQEKIDFFVNTAHNIRTPLTLVLAPLKDIAADKGLGQRGRQFLDMAIENGDRLMTMISQLLDFQKASQKGHEFMPQLLDATTYTRALARKFMVVATDKGITLRTETPEHDLSFISDATILDLVFENLVSNAIKYTPSGGTVTLRAHAGTRHVYFDVADTGIGIPKEARGNLFTAFFRAANAMKGKGTGLGLGITRDLVGRIGGELRWESEEGKGSTFTVVLPLPVHQKAVAVADDRQDSKDTILFVDDNSDLRQYIAMAFGRRYNVVAVADGEEALRYLHDGECDIVVSDIMMPGIQGDELCRRIKDNADTAWLPVILLTAKGNKEFMIDGLRKGADDYIAKPFDTEILASKIESVLANRRRLSKYYMDRSVRQAQKSDDDGNADIEKNEDSVELNEDDKAFVDKATAIVMRNIADSTFTIDMLCREMAMSRTLFYGRLKTLTGQSPQDFIRVLRLERAAALLKGGGTVLEVSIQTGFANVKYFSTVFKKHFGVSPSKYGKGY
jgi:signal transduction histidine kinase/DNA-binding response OmpR family regulator/ligand-binding sensor domain-containing protein